VPERHQTNESNHIITELEAELNHAYQVINQQEEYIKRLQEELAQGQQTVLNTDFTANSISDKLTDAPRKIKTRYLVKKRVPIYPKKSGKLSQLQFTSIVSLVAVLMTILGFAVMRSPNSNSSSEQTQQTIDESPQPASTKVFPSPPTVPSIPETNSPPIPPVIVPPIQSRNPELVYNVTNPPNFRKSQALQSIVDDVVNLAANSGLPKKPLSITLINVKTGEYAEFQEEIPRFPASVVKMFWMVYLYAQIQLGMWNEADFAPYINDMIKRSDNNSSSDILDAITQTESGKNLEGREYEIWLDKRQQVNRFFQSAGYQNININQKTYPITHKKLYTPQGADLKMRGNPKAPLRNKITTQQAGRLLYEIYTSQAVSQPYSEKMTHWLAIDAATRIEKRNEQNPDEFNPVRGFLSESLPTDVYFGGKAGWTSGTRQEAAYIATRDGATYILVVFGEDRAYAYNWKIFPQISDLVLQRMTKLNARTR
jgi:beta-lactamase class A